MTVNDIKNIRIEDFDYPLPDERIALHPLARRDACRLLVAGPGGKITHSVFSDLPILIKPDTLIVANETKVIRARMEFAKPSGARIEIFLLEPLKPHDYVVSFASTSSCSWACLVGNRKRWKENPLEKEVEIAGKKITLKASLEPSPPENATQEVRFEWDGEGCTFAEIIEAAGNIPIPPYLKRESEESDISDYQTVYSHTEGSVAAPTAGLHFTPELLGELKRYGNEFVTVTLHVGAGTFQPVKSEQIGDHPMHTEWISVSRHTIGRLIEALETGRDVLAVGTTSVRTLESLPYLGMNIRGERVEPVTQWMPYEERYRHLDTLRALRNLMEYLEENGLDSLETVTSIMIAPGFRWRVVNRLITNFHQPKSTLLLLVSSFLGGDRWKEVYGKALKEGYRFLSYGDACLFSRGRQSVELPLAKSMTIRAATMLAAGKEVEKLNELESYGQCDDSEYYINALWKLLASTGMPEAFPLPVYIGEGAAPLRFFTALAASMPGVKVKVTAAPGLQKRPIKPLIEALLQMGADIEFNDDPDDWSLIIRGRRLDGEAAAVDTSFTSQYLSALLLASTLWAPATREDFLRKMRGSALVSAPYVHMTEEMLRDPRKRPEPDWSAAAFFYEYCLVSGKPVDIASLTPPCESLQGDAAVCELYRKLGVGTEFHPDGSASLKFHSEVLEAVREQGTFEFDFNSYPDMVPSVAVALCYRRIPFRFSGVGHLRYKECDRLNALQTLLVRIGYEVGIENECLVFNGEFRPFEEFPLEIDPYGDHRMAMAFYPLELMKMVEVADKGVVSKSFPNFYQQF